MRESQIETAKHDFGRRSSALGDSSNRGDIIAEAIVFGVLIVGKTNMQGLEKLRERRLNWVKALRENNFEEGIARLLTEIYPDNAHFIYELLQNAEMLALIK